MLHPALPADHRLAALRAPRPISTGNLLADCERWCRDHLPPRTIPRQAEVIPMDLTRRR
ncbi:hypothetical protein ACI8AF_21765 [Blastococcus sp. SYSU D00669]